jgi:hypothetical protein
MVFGCNATNAPTDADESTQKKKLELIEGYVIVTTILIAFLVVFGSCRRRSHNKWLKNSICIAYGLPMYLITYTLGQMQSMTFHNELIGVWARFLVIFFGSADCISVYSLEENDNPKRFSLEVLVKVYVLGWLIRKSEIDITIKVRIMLYLLFLIAIIRTAERSEAFNLASRSYGLVRNTKLIADFMAYEHTLSDEVDPVCMKGYKYLVKGEEKEKVTAIPPHYQNQLKLTREAITIDMIWECKGTLLSSTGDPDGRLKDICLSYALYRLLCRRFVGYPLYETSKEKTWNFVRNGLFSKEGDHERAFRVIEVELAFLYDLFYTKYAVCFATRGTFKSRSYQLILVIVACVAMVPFLKHYHAPTGDCNITVYGRNVDVLVTEIVIVAIFLMELVQYIVLSFSDWAKVHWLCCYVKKPSWQNNKCIEKILQIVCHRKWLKPWGRNLGQYSLLESYNYNPSRLLYNSWITPYIDTPRNGQTESNRIKLPLEVKKAIIVSLKTTNGQRLKNGEASLQRNGVENELSWACRLETQTHVIMVWHIATSICEIEFKPANLQMESEHFIVANALSKYCAYLVAFAPRFLPDHSYITEVIFDQVVEEARDVLNGCNSATSKHEKMITIGERDHYGKIVRKGVVLANHLKTRITDNERRWKILAEFWADMMLFMTPSDDSTIHAEYLAKGGEFVTHLWALLSHAGILKRDSAHEDV